MIDAKRLLDVVAATLLLIVLVPLIVGLAVAIKLESAGSVFYRSRRVGRNSRQFSILKFRKMYEGAAGPPLTLVDDSRFTRLGRFLARTKLDELPQLWNVIRGEMSLVGPRPEDALFVAHQAEHYRTILTVRPGLTGLCQLAFVREAEVISQEDLQDDYVDRLLPQKAQMDVLYARRRTLVMDLRILLWTLPALLGIDVAVNRQTGRLSRRTGGRSRRGGRGRAAVKAVILAGGRGTRLAPYTSILPKPLLPIGDRPILEHVLKQLLLAGIQDVTLCVGYLSHLIRAVLEDGNSRHPRPRLHYVQEHEPLGTVGPLRLVEGLDETFLLMNGDVLTRLDFVDLVASHRASGSVLTIAAHRRVVKVDYGVLGIDGDVVESFHEKPEIPMSVSAGIYVMEPEVLDSVPASGYFDFPDLVHALLAAGRPIGAYEYGGFWLDLGRPEDYRHAVEFWQNAPEELEGLPEPPLPTLDAPLGATAAWA
jgi:NDP-mannose synthase